MEDTEFKCVVCAKTFSSRCILTNHYANHTPRIRFYVCDICNRGFYFLGRLSNHMKVHKSKNKTFVCSVCEKTFKDEGVYKRHCDLHLKNNSGSFSCVECGKTFNKKQIFEMHQCTREAKTSFRCEVCEKIFFEECDYLNHKDGHQLLLFKCEACSKEFNSTTMLKRHEESHKPRTCSLCLEVFHDVETYYNHWISHENVNTPSTPSEGNTCGYCHEEFKTQNELNDHVATHQYWCSVCSIDFQTLILYKKHIDIHTNEGSTEQDKNESVKYTCNICDIEYKREARFTKHMSLHDISKPFGCEICGKFFEEMRFLKSHQTSHVQKDLLKCDICGKEFTEMLFYNVHRLTHIEQKPIRCDICEDVFTENSAYIRHRRTHMNREEKEAERFVTMREMLKQKLEESEKLPDDDEPEANLSSCEGSVEQDRNEYDKSTSNICDIGHKSEARLTRHMSSNDISKPFGCEICGKFFEEVRFLKSHQTSHVQKCDICGKEFTEMLFYNIHRLTHIEQKPIRCDICEDVFSENSAYIRHRKTHINREEKEAERFVTMREMLKQKLDESEKLPEDDEAEVILGSINNETSETEMETSAHTSTLDDRKPFHCDFCGKLFEDEKTMKQHQDGHVKKKHQVCDICGEIFTENCLFLRHRNSHRRENRESKKGKLKRKLEEREIFTECDENGSENIKSNKNKTGNIQIKIEEVKSLGNIKTNFCDLCGKIFDDEDSLKIHQSEHAKRKLIVCDLCGKEFKETLPYEIHRITHFEQRPYHCDICGDIFTEEYVFTIHSRRHKFEEQRKAKSIFNMREMLKQKLKESQ